MSGGKMTALLGLALVSLGVGLLVLLGQGGNTVVPEVSRNDTTPGLPFPADTPAPIDNAPLVATPHGQADRTVPQDSGPRFGTILGEIQVEAADALPSIDRFWIYLQEARNPAVGSVKTFTREFSYGDQGGRFVLPQVPFGAWRVSVMIQEMVGSEAIRVLSPEEPVGRVVLNVKKGRSLPVFVHDPDRRGLEGVDILLQPRGQPPGRRTLAGKTDGLGNVTFHNVLHGEYEIHLGPQWKPLAEPMRIDVGPVEPAFVRYEVPLGGELKVTVLGPGGYPVAGARCELISPMTSPYREFRATTDQHGIATFGKVPQGKYQIRVHAEGFQVEIRPGVTVEENQENRQDIFLRYPSGF